ncbi:MAG: DUF4390 domain-containing protein, partial [Xanthomonadales bacterium]|nr:DUF4390 domain-containing protein [Xanthomonadales bacterium]
NIRDGSHRGFAPVALCLGALCLGALALPGCSSEQTDFGFSIERIEASASPAALNVVIHQQLTLSTEAKDALDHGVPLAIRTELELQRAGSSGNISQASREFEIRYLPLSNRYQLVTRQPSSVHTYPRLRHVLAELGSVSFTLTHGLLPPGNYQLRARSLLDKQNMPPPMRLPAWFSAQWKLDSGWQSWPLPETSP